MYMERPVDSTTGVKGENSKRLLQLHNASINEVKCLKCDFVLKIDVWKSKTVLNSGTAWIRLP